MATSDRQPHAITQALSWLVLNELPAVLWATDGELRFTLSLGSGLSILGLQHNAVVGTSLFEFFQTQDPMFPTIAAHYRALKGESVFFEQEWSGNTYQARVDPLRDDAGQTIGCVGVAIDITERIKAERILQNTQKELVQRVAEIQLDEARLEAVLQLNHMADSSLQEITDFALEQAVALTSSRIGYLAFMNEDETVLTMHSWSKNVMAACAIADARLVYPVISTGLWGEAARQRKPIITNDYRAPNPWKKGLPDGHVSLHRHMNVPIIESGRVVIVAGVGNKRDEYDDADVRQLTLLMEGMWTLLQRRRMETELRQHRDHLEQLVNERTEALRESEAKYRHLVETTDTGYLILDDDGRVVDANAEYVRISGHVALAEIVGHSVLEWTVPGDVGHNATALRECLKNGRVKDLTIDYRHASGAITPVEINASVIETNKGKRILALCRDISERRRADAALKQSHDELAALYQGMNDGVLIVDIETKRFVRANDAICRMLGYSENELLTKSIKDLHPPERVPWIEEQFTALVQGRLAVSENIPVLRKDRSIFFADISHSGLDFNGRPCSAGFFRDITERRQAQEALEREHRTLKHLLQSSDHERQMIAYDIHDGLAQQIAAAIMQFQLFDHLKDQNPADALKAHEAGLAMLRQSHFEARRLISGVRPPILDESGIVAAIAHLAHDESYNLGAKVEFRSKVTFKRLAPILENAIYRIVQEAVANARKHSKSEKVKVSLSQHAESVRVEIRDWGVGLAGNPGDEDGFGLEGMRQRTRLLGGHFSITSAPGAGTRIVVKLPLVAHGE